MCITQYCYFLSALHTKVVHPVQIAFWFWSILILTNNKNWMTFNMSNVIAIDSWHRRWDYEPTGHFTRQLMPSVGSKIVFFPDSRDVGISYCRLLLHDTLLHRVLLLHHVFLSEQIKMMMMMMITTGLELLIHHSLPVGRTEKFRVIFCWVALNIIIRELSCYILSTIFAH